MKYKAEDLKARARKDARITAQDLFNSYACIQDDELRTSVDKSICRILTKIYDSMVGKSPVKLWVDGSYNPKTKTAGIGIIITTDNNHGIDNVKNIAFGKTVKAKDSLTAEIYALSIGLSYILDTFPDVDNLHVKYDCVNATVCATNIDAYACFGAPYTNFRSALKRAKRRGVNIAFEHVKAHANEEYNEKCDAIAKYYAKIKLPAAQLKQIRKIIKDGG